MATYQLHFVSAFSQLFPLRHYFVPVFQGESGRHFLARGQGFSPGPTSASRFESFSSGFLIPVTCVRLPPHSGISFSHSVSIFLYFFLSFFLTDRFKESEMMPIFRFFHVADVLYKRGNAGRNVVIRPTCCLCRH